MERIALHALLQKYCVEIKNIYFGYKKKIYFLAAKKYIF